jgi:hypothetical protein
MPNLSTDRTRQLMGIFPISTALCVLIGAVMAWNLYVYLGVNWELLGTKHYFMWRYYGGYADSILGHGDAKFVVQRESFSCLGYVASSLTPYRETYLTSLNVDRLFTCGFLPSLVMRLAGGQLEIRSSIVAVNILFWIAAIALTYGAVAAWSKSRSAALIGAAIAAGYPVYGLMFASWKTQDAGALLLLAWIYVDKAIWPRLGWIERALLLDLTLSLTMLASGAGYYIFVYMISWSVFRVLFEPPSRRDAALTIFVTLCAFGIGKFASNALMTHYGLQSTLTVYRVDRMATDTLSILWALLSGSDTSSLRFMNYPGFSFLTQVLPWFIKLFLKANPIIVIVPLVGMFLVRELRALALIVPALFLVGHAPAIITGWTWYYGYSSAPATHLLIVGTAFCLGLHFDSKLAIVRAASTAALLAAIYFFNASPAFNFRNFFTDEPSYPIDRRLYVYHDDHVTRYW